MVYREMNYKTCCNAAIISKCTFEVMVERSWVELKLSRRTETRAFYGEDLTAEQTVVPLDFRKL
jgi:hypothetical protein